MTRQSHGPLNEPGLSLPSPQSPPGCRYGGIGRSTSSTVTTPPSPTVARKVAGPAGFLGLTSFSATFRDHEAEVANKETETNADAEMHQDPAHISMGLNVLKRLPGHDDCQSLLGRYLDSLEEVGFLKRSIKNIVDTLFTLYQPQLIEPRKDVDLESISRDVTRNGEDSLILPDDAIGWMEAFSGPNTRWESIGILFCALAYGVLGVPENDFGRLGLSLAYSDKKNAVLGLKEAVEWCIELCRHALNTLVCNLLYKNLLLETLIQGDSSKSSQHRNKYRSS
jgi:hypothetical protein